MRCYRTLAFTTNNAGFAILGPPPQTFFALTLVCRQIHNETRLLLFQLNTWYIHDYLDHKLNRRPYTYQHFPWSHALSAEQLAAIRTVRLSYDLVYDVSQMPTNSTDNRRGAFITEARKFSGVRRVVLELKEYYAANRSIRERDWDAAVKGVWRCFPSGECEILGVLRGWDNVISPHIPGEEVVFREGGRGKAKAEES